MPLGRRRNAVAADDPAAVEGRGAGAGRGRVAAARGAWAVGSVLLLIARLVRLIVGIIVLVIVAAIVLKVLDANGTNTIVKDIHDAASSLVGPFDGIFKQHDKKVALAINWGIAAAVYLVVGAIIASLIARVALAARGSAEV